MVEEENKQRLYRDYTATCMGIAAKALVAFSGGTWEMPSYIELAYPQQKDSRGAKEIVEGLLARLK